MTKRELVKNAIMHKQQEKVPSCIHLAGDAIEKYTDALFERYAGSLERKLVNSGRLSKYDGVRLAIGNDVFAMGCPWWNWHNLPPEYFYYDAPSFLPKTMGYGSYEGFIDMMRLIKEQTGCYIMVNIYGSHFEKAYFARGIENFLADLAGEPEYAEKLLKKIIDKNVVMLENIVEITDIDGILLGSDWGSQRSLLMSPTIWRELIAPGEQKEYDIIKSTDKDVWIHSCGCIDAIIPDLVAMGIDVLNPVQPECMDISALKQNFGEKLTFWGGISTQLTLPYGTIEEVCKETRRVTDIMSKNGGYIISPSQEIQADVPFENLCALIDTAKSYGL